MPSNAPDPPGSHFKTNPPDRAYSPSKPQGILSAVVAAVPQDTHSQITSGNTPNVIQSLGLTESQTQQVFAPYEPMPSPTTAHAILAPYEPTPSPNTAHALLAPYEPTPSPTTVCAVLEPYKLTPSEASQVGEPRALSPLPSSVAEYLVRTPSYEPTPDPTRAQDNNPRRLDDFAKYLRFPPLPPDALHGPAMADPDQVPDISQFSDDIKNELGLKYSAYANYFLGPALQLVPDATVGLRPRVANTIIKAAVVLFDVGIDRPGGNLTHQGLTPNSWFRAAFAVLGAIIRGALRSPQFAKAGKHGLDTDGDHMIIDQGLPRPHSQIELLQMMADQLARFCGAPGGDVPANLVDQALAQVRERLTTHLYETEQAKITDEDRALIRQQVIEKLTMKYQSELASQETRAALIEQDAKAEYARMVAAATDKIRQDLRQQHEDTLNQTRAQILAEISSEMKAWKLAESTKRMESLQSTLETSNAQDTYTVLKAKALQLGYDLVERQSGPGKGPKKRKVTVPADAGSKRTRSGSRVRGTMSDDDSDPDVTPTRGRGRRPLKEVRTPTSFEGSEDAPMPLAQEDYTPPMKDTKPPNAGVLTDARVLDLQQKLEEIAQRKEDANQGIYSSMHAPGNQMEDDTTPPAEHNTSIVQTPMTPAPSTLDPALASVMNSLNAITGTLNTFNARFDALEQRMSTIERPHTSPPLSSVPPIKQILSTLVLDTRTNTAKPAPTTTSAPPTTTPESNMATSTTSGPPPINTATRPNITPILPTSNAPAQSPWIKVARAGAITNQGNVQRFAKTAKSVAGGPPPTQTTTRGRNQGGASLTKRKSRSFAMAD